MIDRQLAAFLEDGLGIHIATRNERLHPGRARAAAVKVDEDGRHMTVYAATIAASRLPDFAERAAMSARQSTGHLMCV